MPKLPQVTTADLRRVRRRLLQMHFESGVGHIGGNLSAIDAMMLVFHEYLRDEDEFILSKGHSAGALYAALWSLDKIAEDDLKKFHKDDTLLAGHPPAQGLPGVPFATGSLGHGLSLAAGTALAFRLKGEPRNVYCMTSDGEWQEGSTLEALIFACHQKLSNLTILVDHNRLQGFGDTSQVASMAPLAERLRGFDLRIETLPGHDLGAIRQSLDVPANGPRMLVLETVKGKGVSFLENRLDSHYLPLDEAQYRRAISELSA